MIGCYKMRVKESETVRSFLAIELAEDLVPKILNVQKEFKKTNANIKCQYKVCSISKYAFHIEVLWKH